jgi:two-component system sensor histidine kinase/response regulator
LPNAPQAKQIELVAMVDSGLPDQLVGDPGRIQQVLLNLLSNAVKFTERGEIFVHARPLRTQKQNQLRTWVELRVRDTGIGISRTAQKKLFQPFTQADSTTTRKYGGTGLGLALCKQIIDAMDGTLSISSKVGVGSEFVIQIPLRHRVDPGDCWLA